MEYTSEFVIVCTGFGTCEFSLSAILMDNIQLSVFEAFCKLQVHLCIGQ